MHQPEDRRLQGGRGRGRSTRWPKRADRRRLDREDGSRRPMHCVSTAGKVVRHATWKPLVTPRGQGSGPSRSWSWRRNTVDGRFSPATVTTLGRTRALGLKCERSYCSPAYEHSSQRSDCRAYPQSVFRGGPTSRCTKIRHNGEVAVYGRFGRYRGPAELMTSRGEKPLAFLS